MASIFCPIFHPLPSSILCQLDNFPVISLSFSSSRGGGNNHSGSHTQMQQTSLVYRDLFYSLFFRAYFLGIFVAFWIALSVYEHWMTDLHSFICTLFQTNISNKENRAMVFLVSCFVSLNFLPAAPKVSGEETPRQA